MVCANDLSNFGNTDFGVSGRGVKGGVGTAIVDVAENLRCPAERGCGGEKFAVETDKNVDTEPRLSNLSAWSLSTSDIGFACATWKRACGGSEPKTCDTEQVHQVSNSTIGDQS